MEADTDRIVKELQALREEHTQIKASIAKMRDESARRYCEIKGMVDAIMRRLAATVG